MTTDLSTFIAELYRERYRDVVGPLVRTLGSFERAEEVAQESFMVALEQWAEKGVPAQPVAWLRRVARNRAIDQQRRGATWNEKSETLALAAELLSEERHEQEPDPERIQDDVLRLIFTCCHPALPPRDRIALTLHTVCGLTSDEVARALLLSRSALQQRLVRAKRKIDVAGIPYIVPTVRDMHDRLQSVLQTCYSMFTEGYASTNDERLVRAELCDEAIRLVRLLRRVLPGQAEVEALLALMLLHHARAAARVDRGGSLVRLHDQDRTLWDQSAIAEALPLVEGSLRARPLSRYAVEAAIAALHVRSSTAVDTDWQQIVELYEVLAERGWGSPVVDLNHAVALAFAGRPEASLEQLEALAESASLRDSHLLHVALAETLGRLGRRQRALVHWERALELVASPVERSFLTGQVEAARKAVLCDEDRAIAENLSKPVDRRGAQS